MHNSQIQLLSPMSLVHFNVCVKSMCMKTDTLTLSWPLLHLWLRVTAALSPDLLYHHMQEET